MATWLAGGGVSSSAACFLHGHCFFFGWITRQDKGFEDQAALQLFFFLC
jgi:hypothetical protein